jgi:uncharacterized protein YegP (UPF0339 family)
MHWILTIFIYANGNPMIDHQEYYSRHNCIAAAELIKKTFQFGQYTCTQKDDNPLP